MLDDLLDLGISPVEKTIRTIAVYVALLFLLRLAGKRQLAQLNAFDLIVLLLLSNVVQNAVIGNDLSLTGGLLGAAVLIAANYLFVRYALLHPTLGRVLQGGESVLAEHGRPNSRELRRQLISEMELDSALRRQGVDGIAATERVVLEPEGALTATERPQPTLTDVLDRLDRIERKLG
jgi:uncharacterized membrane protein YcaP (DUF421 family)